MKSATQLHTIYLSKFTITITEKYKKQITEKNETWYVENFFLT